MATFIDNTTKNIKTYLNGTMICACAYVVIMDDVRVAFDTMAEAENYAKQFVYYQIEPEELVLELLDGCIYSPGEELAK
jgi:hypothetical protein